MLSKYFHVTDFRIGRFYILSAASMPFAVKTTVNKAKGAFDCSKAEPLLLCVKGLFSNVSKGASKHHSLVICVYDAMGLHPNVVLIATHCTQRKHV